MHAFFKLNECMYLITLNHNLHCLILEYVTTPITATIKFPFKWPWWYEYIYFYRWEFTSISDACNFPIPLESLSIARHNILMWYWRTKKKATNNIGTYTFFCSLFYSEENDNDADKFICGSCNEIPYLTDSLYSHNHFYWVYVHEWAMYWQK